MNDTTYVASVLGAHRAAGLRRDIEILALRAAREGDAQPLGGDASARPATEAAASARRRGLAHWLHRPARRSTFVAAP